MKITQNNPVWTPVSITFETKDEWRAFLSMLGSEADIGELIDKDLGAEFEGSTVIANLISYDDWSKYRQEVGDE